MAPGLRLLLMLGLALVLGGCATVRLGYEMADRLILGWADGYLDFDASQEAFVRGRLQSWIDWHRRSELPVYVHFIGEAQEALAGPLDAEALLAFERRLRDRVRESVERAAPDFVRLALTLSPAQIDRLETRLAEGTAKARRERAADERTIETRAARYGKRLDPWIGDLNSRQQAELRVMLARRPSGWEAAFAHRSRWQAALVGTLRRIRTERPDPALAREWLLDWMRRAADPVDRLDPERSARTRHDAAEVLARMLDLADAEQRARLIRRLGGYAEDFRVLSARATSQ
jgi:hypothetical protein